MTKPDNPPASEKALAVKIARNGHRDLDMGIWLAGRACDGDDCERLLERLRHAVAELERTS